MFLQWDVSQVRNARVLEVTYFVMIPELWECSPAGCYTYILGYICFSTCYIDEIITYILNNNVHSGQICFTKVVFEIFWNLFNKNALWDLSITPHAQLF